MSNYAKLGNYLLIEKQEETGIAEWWRGATLSGQKIDSYFLVDVINSALVADRGFVDHYLNQSTITTKLEHPNILRKVTSTFENGTLASVFEFHEGFSLEKVLERCREDGFPLAIDHALLVGSKLLSALAYAKGKHITHGFLNPSVVFVTHEGEIKLKGFSVSSALRHFSGALPFGDRYKTYVPQQMEMLSDDRDHLDIYGVGSILFEMLTGETVLEASGGSAAEKVANALTAADGEAIPAKIAAILTKSLDRNQPDSYHDIQVMAKDMEDLLFSGEYSPTTFNLAFFMHSAFRMEMEELNDKLSKEKEKDFGSIASAAAPVSAPAAAKEAAPPPSRSEVTMPEANTGTGSYAGGNTGKKGGLPVVPIAIGAVVVIIAMLAFVFMGGGGDDNSNIDQMAQQLEEEGRLAEQAELKRQQEELKRQNQMLMEQIQEQQRKEAEEEKAMLEADMKRMDEEIARLQREQKRKEDLAKLEEERKRLAEEKAKVEQMQREAEERRQKREEAQRLAKEREAKQAQTEQVAQGEQAVGQPTTDSPSSPSGSSSQVAKNTGGSSNQSVADSGAATEKGEVILSEENLTEYGGNQPASPSDIPKEGDLIEFDDPYLQAPVLLESYTPQEAPRKAVRAGLVKKGGNLNFYMRVLINTKGEVDDVELFRSPLADNNNDYGMIERASKVVKDLRFSVPRKHGVKVKTWWFIPVIFTAK